MRNRGETGRALWAVVVFACGCYGADVGAPGPGTDAAGAALDAGPRDTGAVEDSAAESDGGPVDAGSDLSDGGIFDAAEDAASGDGNIGDTDAVGDGGAAVGEDGGTLPSDAGADAGCKPPIVFERPDEFIPTVAAPVLHVEIPMENGLVFGKVELEIDFVRGPWSTVPPGPDRGMSNVFWLHRGMKGNHWLGNLVGYMNFKSQDTLELSANLGITDPQVWKQAISKRVPTVQGEAYHAQFAYDAAGAKLWFRAFHAGSEVAYAETAPLVSEIVGWDIFKGGQPGFFVETGFASGDGATVEIPTYDWVYSNLVIRFHFLEGGC